MQHVKDNNKNIVSDIAFAAVFAALIVVLAFVSIPTASGVPIVLQNAAIILTALILGPKRGFYAVALFFVLAAVNLPVLAGGRTLWAAAAGPTVGYLIGYLLSPLAAGWVSAGATRSKVRMTVFLALGSLAGFAVQYAFGIGGLILRAGMDLKAALLAQVPFLPGMGIKLVIICVIAVGVHMALPHLRNFRQLTVNA
ncbi:biotin transporter BioY [Corynebacterium mendelii]|uniref:Biotin transporter n=1 Tax=Corynebacterium mendelii TaxID=2765362 RepID=A0A939DYS8_9CORY|nr:biotin transporter BioY [Corynebacterium mendelii]MBN9643304.1 biotin transporter BioY [Corynebacterium mendelii]